MFVYITEVLLRAYVCVHKLMCVYIGSPGAKVIIQLLHSDADSVYCIQAVPLDIMSAEI